MEIDRKNHSLLSISDKILRKSLQKFVSDKIEDKHGHEPQKLSLATDSRSSYLYIVRRRIGLIAEHTL